MESQRKPICYHFKIDVLGAPANSVLIKPFDISIKIAPSCSLLTAIEEVFVELTACKNYDNFTVANHLSSVFCNGISITKSLYGLPLDDIHDSRTPVETLPIIIRLKNSQLNDQRALSDSTDVDDHTQFSNDTSTLPNTMAPPSLIYRMPKKRIATGSPSTGDSSLTMPGNLIVFAELRCPNLGIQLNFFQFDTNITDTFTDLLYNIVQFHRDDGRIPADIANHIIISEVVVHHFPSPSTGTRAMIRSPLESSCEALHVSNNRFLRFHSSASYYGKKHVILSGDEITSLLMSSQRHLVFPQEIKYVSKSVSAPPFGTLLYNYLAKLVLQKKLGVDRTALPLLEQLLRSVRDVLWMAIPKVCPISRYPLLFRHNITRSDNKYRVTFSQKRMNGLNAKLLDCLARCGFLIKGKWEEFHNNCKSLYSLVNEQIQLMQNHSTRQILNHNKESNSISDCLRNATIFESNSKATIPPCYVALNQLLSEKCDFSYVVVTRDEIDKWYPSVDSPEANNVATMRRYIFRRDFIARDRVATIQHHVGGQIPLIWILWKVPSAQEMSNPTADVLRKQTQCQVAIAEHLPRYTTRVQWRHFQNQYGDVIGGGVPSGMLRSIYRELTKDSTSPRSVKQEEVVLRYVISRGDPSLWPDLRAAMNGAEEQYSIFFSVAQQVIEEVTCATPYRHGSERVLTPSNADLVSIRSLHSRIVKDMRNSTSEETRDAPYPSDKLLSISLCPQYASRETAKYYNCRFQLRRGLLKASMRKDNPDAHYNHKLNQYGNAFTIEINSLVYKMLKGLAQPCDNSLVMFKGCTKISVDDKAAVPVGEPGYPVRTNVRKISASLNGANTLALDHDFHRASIRPSMCIFIKTPTELAASWRHGLVTAVLKDACTQYSTAIRHSVELSTQIEQLVCDDNSAIGTNFPFGIRTVLPYGFYIRSDGGSDRNPKNASVQISYIYMFLRLDADYLIVIVTAPDTSACNEVEAIMPLANLALQNQSFARETMSNSFEKLFKGSLSGKTMRSKIADQKDTDSCNLARDSWRSSLDPVRKTLEDRFRRTSYCDRPIRIFDPVEDVKLYEMAEYIQECIDPTYDPKKTSWADIQKNVALMRFIEEHVVTERYHIEIRKCGEKSCKVCNDVRMPPEIWEEICKRPRLIPLPTPTEPGGKKEYVKYRSYEDLRYQQTKPHHRPSFKPPTEPSNSSKEYDDQVSESSRLVALKQITSKSLYKKLWHTNYAKATVVCNHCSRPRVIYHWPGPPPITLQLDSKGTEYSPGVPEWRRLLDELDGILSEGSYQYFCGDALFGILEDPVPHPSCLEGFHVPTALTCGMPIEKQYYSTVNIKKFLPICSWCGSKNDLSTNVMVQEIEPTKKCRPLCMLCLQNGKKPTTYGNVAATKVAASQNRGSAYSKSSNVNMTKNSTSNEMSFNNDARNPSTSHVDRSSKHDDMKKNYPGDNSEASNLLISHSSTPGTPGLSNLDNKKRTINNDNQCALIKKEQPKKKQKGQSSKNKISMSNRSKKSANNCSIGSISNFFNPQKQVADTKQTKELPPEKTSETFWQFMSEIGTTIDVPADGNCGYHVLGRGLTALSKCHASSITSMRKELYEYGIRNKEKMVERAQMSYKQLDTSASLVRYTKALKCIYEEGVNYDHGAPSKDWFDTLYVLPLALLKYKIGSIIIYCHDSSKPNHTISVQADDDNIVWKWNYSNLTPFRDLHYQDNTLVMIHLNGNHYQYLQLKDKF
jgi:hypothetical protein